MIPTGIITVSDRASAQVYADLGGPAVRAAVATHGWQTIAEALVPDDQAQIAHAVQSFARQGCHLILTTGGTGIASRDVTPEAIRSVARLEIPGFGESMRMQSIALTPNAILSRSLGAVVENSLVIALPGKPQGAVDCLGFIAGANIEEFTTADTPEKARVIIGRGWDAYNRLAAVKYPTLALVRGHWGGVEIRNHWRRDAVWGEDRSRTRHPGVLASLAGATPAGAFTLPRGVHTIALYGRVEEEDTYTASGILVVRAVPVL